MAKTGQTNEARRELTELLLEHNPYSLRDHVRLGDLYYERLQRPKLARKSYRTALKLSELNYLDPAKPLTEQERQRIEARLGQ